MYHKKSTLPHPNITRRHLYKILSPKNIKNPPFYIF